MSLRFAVERADLDPSRRRVEVVERKGPGHPDSLCDAAAEAFSRRLSRAYIDAAGRILHHNVDKALLVAGRTQVGFGEGRFLAPIRLVLAGRATTRFGQRELPVDALARGAAEEAFARVRRLDARDPRQVQVELAVSPGAAELQQVFEHAARAEPLAGDTSIGVGFAPFSRVEALARAVSDRVAEMASGSSPLGEDTKVMVVRNGDAVQLTLAVATLATELPDRAAYLAATESVREMAAAEAAARGFAGVRVRVNAADDEGRAPYLTLSGSSAECGDDGQVGRGNRQTGLITPMRAMTLEAYAGKNPATHVGKLLSLAADRAARDCAALEGVRAAECVLVSRIGAPVSEPQIAGVRLDTQEPIEELRDPVERIVSEQCSRLPVLWREIVGERPPAPA
jgi:S-adenosylmethionine synthetase